MPGLEDRLSWLTGEPSDAVAAVLLGTLGTAKVDELPAIAGMLLRTGRANAVAAVIRTLDRLPESGRRLVEQTSCEFGPGLARALEQPRPQVSLNALRVIEWRGEPRLLQHLLPLLESKSPEVARMAGEVMRSVVMRLVESQGGRLTNRTWQTLDDAVADALESWRHHRHAGVLMAGAAMTARPGPRMRAILKEEDHPAALAMRGVVERTDEAIVRRRMLRWLMIEPLNRQVMRWMHKLRGPEEYADLLSEGCLMLLPRIRRMLARVDRACECLLPLEGGHVNLPERVQRELAVLPGALGINARRRVEFLGQLRCLSSSVARLKAVGELAAFETEDSNRALLAFAGDEDRHVANVAGCELLARAEARGGRDALPVGELELAGSPRVVRAARRQQAASSVERYFQRWHALEESAWLAIAMRCLRLDRRVFLRRLGGTILSDEMSDAAQGIALARRLRVVAELEALMMRSVQRVEGRVASSAAMALVDGASHERLDVLRDALRHSDARVRANAVEAMATISRRGEHRLDARRATPWLQKMAEQEDNRLRGNAVLALLRAREVSGHSHLRSMLQDERPLHRVSAIWVARSAGAHDARTQLREMTASDMIPEIQIRAATALRWLGEDSNEARTTA